MLLKWEMLGTILMYRDDFFLKSEMFYNILGYNGGTIINGITVSKTDNYNA